MKTAQLFPKPKRRMKQPTKYRLRQTIREYERRIIELQEENQALRRPWWKRINWRKVG